MASTLNFDSIIPVTLVGPVNSFITIPAFSYSGFFWKGASEIITQFNYTASKNFVLRRLPTVPANVNFVPVISYRIGMQTFRYKLWQHVSEHLAENLYNGEVIKKNFKIEIWNVEDYNEVSLASALTLNLSIRQFLSDFSSLSPTAECSSVEVSQQAQISTAPALVSNGLLAHYATGSEYESTITQSGGLISAWADNSSNGYNLAQAVNADKPQAVTVDGFTRLSFDTTRWIGKVGGISGQRVHGAYLVAAHQFNPANARVFDFGVNFGRCRINAGTGNLTISDDAGAFVTFPNFTDTFKSEAYLRYHNTNEEYVCAGDINFFAPLIDGVSVGSVNPSADITQIILGDSSSIISANMIVYEFILYNRQLTDAEHVQVLQYLANRYNAGGFVLPIQWDDNIPQTTN